MWIKLRDSWLSPKGYCVLGLWTTAIVGVSFWTYQRKNRSIIIAKNSDEKNDLTIKINDENRNSVASNIIPPQLKILSQNQQTFWCLWKLRSRLYPNYIHPNTFYTLSLPLIMATWYFFRGKVRSINSQLAANLANKNWPKLFPATVSLALYAIPAAIFGKLMTVCTLKLSLSMRSHLVQYYQHRYLAQNTYNIKRTLKYPDQRLTSDVEKFSTSLSKLYNNILWSVGGCTVLSASLIYRMGWRQFSSAMLYAFISRQMIAKYLSPSFTDLVQNIQLAENEWRATHSKIAEYAEEITILSMFGMSSNENDGRIEENLLAEYYKRVSDALNAYYLSTMATEMFGSYFTGEIGYLVGYIAMIPAVFYVKDANVNTVEYLATVVQELAFLTKLFERVFRIAKQLSEVNGLANRILEIEDVINHHQNYNQRQMIVNIAKKKRKSVDWKIIANTKNVSEPGNLSSFLAERKPAKTIINNSQIRLENITIATPLPLCAIKTDIHHESQQILMENLNLTIKQFEHTFIEGANGVGKTSLFRVIAGLWAPVNGCLQIPENKYLFFLSQRPYLVPNMNFRQQMCYPCSVPVMIAPEFDANLICILKFVEMYDLVEMRGGLEQSEISGLSGGELQRIGMARCLYHKPRFALLDECSSAVSAEMKHKFFMRCKEYGITLITIAHDASLIKYHTQVLSITRDSWKIKKVEIVPLVSSSTRRELLSDEKEERIKYIPPKIV